MFESQLAWLNSLTPAQKNELVNNTANFNRLRTYLAGKKFMIVDSKTGDFVVNFNCAEAAEFIELAAKMKMPNIIIRDERPK
jgi:hypothetical protein